MHKFCYIAFIFSICSFFCTAQDIEQFNVFAGRFDYVAIGNTLNLEENGGGAPCEILDSSSATLSLSPDQSVIAAYLYWAGSGTGDFDVAINNEPIVAERTFADEIDAARPFFAAFANITELVQNTGNGSYTFSELDLNDILINYCPTGTNFGGWSIIVVFEDLNLPLNQVNIFDGLQSVSQFDNNLTIELTNLNVLDNEDAKIGFLAWEGDQGIAVEETLSINGNLLSNPPLNPENNQFNGTNTFTDNDMLFNMDIDFYDIENTIDIGDTTATIELTSGQDFVMINTVITVLNSQLPDAVIAIDGVQTVCGSRDIVVTYTVTNQGTEILPANTSISFYGDGIFTGQSFTSQPVSIDASLTSTANLTIVNTIPDIFDLIAVVDDPDSIVESDESNNVSTMQEVNLGSISILDFDSFLLCDDISNDGIAIFDLTTIGQQAIDGLSNIEVSYYINETDAINDMNAIMDPANFQNSFNSQTIFIRFQSTVFDDCFLIVPLLLEVLYQPFIQDIPDLEICDDTLNNDGIANFDLTIQNNSITIGQPDVVVSYHTTSEDADSGMNPIVSPANFTNITNPQTIYVRLENENFVGCFDTSLFELQVNPLGNIRSLPRLKACNEGFEIGTFDLTAIADISGIEIELIQGFFESLEDAQSIANHIIDPFQYQNTSNLQTIYIRIEGDDAFDCFEIAEFELEIENCPPFIPEGFSPNGDTINDTFEISGIKNVFDYELLIYSRLGNLIYRGTNEIPFWDGTPNKGIGGDRVPTGVYYWVLYLNDSEINDQIGWVYLNR